MATHDGIDFRGMFQAVFSAEDGIRQLVEYLVNAGMQQEVAEPLQAASHERSDRRQGYHNGVKPDARGRASPGWRA